MNAGQVSAISLTTRRPSPNGLSRTLPGSYRHWMRLGLICLLCVPSSPPYRRIFFREEICGLMCLFYSRTPLCMTRRSVSLVSTLDPNYLSGSKRLIPYSETRPQTRILCRLHSLRGIRFWSFFLPVVVAIVCSPTCCLRSPHYLHVWSLPVSLTYSTTAHLGLVVDNFIPS